MADYRIDDLARVAGTTVRNVRVYQDRGLLPAPRKQGRTGVYDDAHLARLRLIGQLLERGYTFAHIGEFLEAWQRGRNLTELLGLEDVLTAPWSDEIADWRTAEELVEMFGEDQLTEDNLAEALAQEFFLPEGDRYRIPSPRLLHAGSELVLAGIPLGVVLALGRSLAEDMERSAARLVGAVEAHVVRPHPAVTEFDDHAVADLAALIARLKPLAQLAVDAQLAKAMEKQVRATLDAHLVQARAQGGETAAS